MTMNMMNIIQKSKAFLHHPLGRGMLSYSITWPTGCIIQQLFDKKSFGKCSCSNCDLVVDMAVNVPKGT